MGHDAAVMDGPDARGWLEQVPRRLYLPEGVHPVDRHLERTSHDLAVMGTADAESDRNPRIRQARQLDQDLAIFQAPVSIVAEWI